MSDPLNSGNPDAVSRDLQRKSDPDILAELGIPQANGSSHNANAARRAVLEMELHRRLTERTIVAMDRASAASDRVARAGNFVAWVGVIVSGIGVVIAVLLGWSG